MLKINDIKTHFFTKIGIVQAVDGISIEIPKGKIIGIVGESGCGKSMTAMSIMGLVQQCRFSPRCERAKPICFEKESGIFKINENHHVRCFLYENWVIDNE